MPRTLYCKNCSRAVLVTYEVPARCLGCGQSTWRLDGEPREDYALSVMDRRFLHSLRIDPEV